MKQGTNTISYIPDEKVSNRKEVRCGRLMSDIRPYKEGIHRVKLTVDGDRLEYPYDMSTPTTDLTTAKYLINSTLLTTNNRASCGDTNTRMETYENMKLRLGIIPYRIIQQHRLNELSTNG